MKRLARVTRVNNFDLTGLQAAVRSVAHLRGHAQEIIRATREFVVGMAGDAAGEQFTIGTAEEVLPQVEQLVATGVDCLIFNMPLTDPDTVERAGKLLTSNFA